MFIDKAAVVGFYRYFKKLQSKLFKRRGAGDRAPGFGPIWAPRLCSCVTSDTLRDLSEPGFSIWKMGAGNSPSSFIERL